MGPAKPPSSVLFVCGMNAIRSPMAAGLMQKHFPGEVYVASAGVHQGDSDGFVTTVMDEIGVDLSHHKPTALDDLNDTSFDLIITLAPEAHHKALELTRTLAVDVEYWPTEDPTLVVGARDVRLDAYRRVRDKLQSRIRQRFNWRHQAGH